MLTFNAPGTTQTSSPQNGKVSWRRESARKGLNATSSASSLSFSIGEASCLIWLRRRQVTFPFCRLISLFLWLSLIELGTTMIHPQQCFGEVLIRTLATFRSLESIECYYYTWRYLYTRKNLSNPNSCSSISLDSSSLWNKLSSSSCRFLSRSSFLAESSSSSSSSPGIEGFNALE